MTAPSQEATRAVDYVQSALAAQADPITAKGMASYMRTAMPFYGVQKPGRVPILRRLRREHPPATRTDYEELVTALWELPHREEKYLAQAVAGAFPEFVVPASLPLYRRFIVDGAWWDFVDETATHLIRPLVIGFPEEVWPIVELWVDDEDMWLRRAAIICQVGAGAKADGTRLFAICEARMHETEFFIRKAIGWALRDHARTAPAAVAGFVVAHRDELSGLSFREATRHIGHLVAS